MIKKAHKYLLFLLVFFTVESCSLVKFENPALPISNKDINTRLRIHEFAHQYLEEIESISDSIITLGNTSETNNENLLYWKISTGNALNKTAFQTSPTIALLDTWNLTITMDEIIKKDSSFAFFGPDEHLAVFVTDSLNNEMESLVKKLRSKKEYEDMKDFMEEFRAKVADKTLKNRFISVKQEWLSHINVEDTMAVTTVGTLPQVLTETTDQVKFMGEHTKNSVIWNTEYFIQKNDLDKLEFKAKMDSLIDAVQYFGEATEKAPARFSHAMEDAFVRLEPTFQKIDERLQTTLDSLSAERKYLMQDLASEREIIMTQLDSIAVRSSDIALKHVRGIISDALFYIVIILIIIIVLPFGMGVVFGKMMEKRKNDKRD